MTLKSTHPSTDTHLGNLIGDSISGVVTSGLDEAMKAVWEGATWILNTAFSAADTFSTFTVDAHTGPVGAVWPTLVTVSAAIALGLFFWQLTLSALRGGKGMMRVATGPIAYGIALAMTVAGIAAALATADGLTTLILSRGLNVTNFSQAFTHTSLGGQALNGIKAVALGLIGVFGLVPAAIGWVLEIIWRQAAILVLVATIPITAAGLLAHTTASWFWRGLRWTIAAITVKPVLALIIVVGVSSLAGATGPVGLLAGVAVLWVSLTAPMALFRLLAFVDPATDAGQVFRESWSQLSSQLFGGSSAGGSAAPGGSGSGAGSGDGSGAEPGGMGALESANTSRFDAAGSPGGGAGGGGQDMPPPPPSGSATGSGSSSPAGGAGGPASSSQGDPGGSGTSTGLDDSTAVGHDGGGQGVPSAAAEAPGDAGASRPTPYPRSSGGGGGSGGSGGGAAAGAADGAIDAAVIL